MCIFRHGCVTFLNVVCLEVSHPTQCLGACIQVSLFAPSVCLGVCTDLRQDGCVLVNLSAQECPGVLQEGQEGRTYLGPVPNTSLRV